jgi:hypothetical protein
VPLLKTDNTSAFAYNDDIFVEAQKEAVDELQRANIQLDVWTEDNKMTIQSDKSTSMMASLVIQKEQHEIVAD